MDDGRGYELHRDTADGQIPISAVFANAMRTAVNSNTGRSSPRTRGEEPKSLLNCGRSIPKTPGPDLGGAKRERHKLRTVSERVNARWKDAGGSQADPRARNG